MKKISCILVLFTMFSLLSIPFAAAGLTCSAPVVQYAPSVYQQSAYIQVSQSTSETYYCFVGLWTNAASNYYAYFYSGSYETAQQTYNTRYIPYVYNLTPQNATRYDCSYDQNEVASSLMDFIDLAEDLHSALYED